MGLNLLPGRRILFYILLGCFFLTQVTPFAYSASVPSNPAAPSLNLPAQAAVLMDAASGRVLYAQNSHTRLPMASLTKIMTGLLVVEDGQLGQNVEVSLHAAKTGESSIYLKMGENLTRKELLYASMLNSANDATTALAESIAGSESAFVDLMNQRAGKLGLQDTHFCNPHGLEAAGHYSSAYDLAWMSRQAMTEPVFRQVVATKSIYIPGSKHETSRLLVNENRLLYCYAGTLGVKTGYTKKAGNCVVAAARRGDLELIAVAMNSTDVYGDLQKMLDYGFANYQLVTVKTADQLSLLLPVSGGQTTTVTARPACDLNIAVTSAEKSQLRDLLFPCAEVAGPVKQGDCLGFCSIYLQGREVSRLNLWADADVPANQTIWTRVWAVIRSLPNLKL